MSLHAQMLGLPLAIAFLAWALVPPDFGRPLWAYVAFIVSFDVAHVWSTAYLTYWDREAFARWRSTLLSAPIVAFGLAFALHRYDPVVYWTALAYIAIGHFAKQNLGFVRLYAAAGGRRDRATRRWDSAAVYAGTLGPVLLWHADPSDVFDWFGSGETFVLRLPEAAAPAIALGMLSIGVAWLGREGAAIARGARRTPWRWGWMLSTWITWWIGLRVVDDFLVAAAFINLAHGIPYTLLVWRRTRARAERGQADHLPRIATAAFPLFYGVLLVAALGEEWLWDRFVWGDYVRSLGAPEPSEGASRSLWIALLSLPQTVHYYLDGVLWRRDPRNDDLSGLL